MSFPEVISISLSCRDVFGLAMVHSKALRPSLVRQCIDIRRALEASASGGQRHVQMGMLQVGWPVIPAPLSHTARPGIQSIRHAGIVAVAHLVRLVVAFGTQGRVFQDINQARAPSVDILQVA